MINVTHEFGMKSPISIPIGETWHSKPLLPTTPFEFYRLRFRSKAASPGYWAVFPFSADGEEMRADTHSTVYASDDWMAHETFFRGLPGAVSVKLGFRAREDAMEVRDIEVTPADDDSVRAWADDLYAKLSPVTFQPAADRHALIPQTMARMRGGETIRMVMLGDSISQDTCNSFFDILVERDYPGSDLQLVPSVDGGKGCWYYIDEELFERYVVKQKPELLMVGTASERDGIEPIEQLLRRVRDTLDCEVMVVSGPLGDDYRFPPNDNSDEARKMRENASRAREFAREQETLCQGLGVEYLDLRTAWMDYMEASGKPRNWFHRDAAHADDRGKQVLARMMALYFTP